MNSLFITIMGISVLIKWSYTPPPSPIKILKIKLIVLTIEFRNLSIFSTCNPIFFKYMVFLCQFLDPHLTTYYSITIVQITSVGFRYIYLYHMANVTFPWQTNKDTCNAHYKAYN